MHVFSKTLITTQSPRWVSNLYPRHNKLTQSLLHRQSVDVIGHGLMVFFSRLFKFRLQCLASRPFSHSYKHVCTSVCIPVVLCVYLCFSIGVCVNICVRGRVWVFVCVCECLYLCENMCVHMCLLVCVSYSHLPPLADSALLSQKQWTVSRSTEWECVWVARALLSPSFTYSTPHSEKQWTFSRHSPPLTLPTHSLKSSEIQYNPSGCLRVEDGDRLIVVTQCPPHVNTRGQKHSSHTTKKKKKQQ